MGLETGERDALVGEEGGEDRVLADARGIGMGDDGEAGGGGLVDEEVLGRAGGPCVGLGGVVGHGSIVAIDQLVLCRVS